MPRYFFHLQDGTVSLDRDGAELPDWANARVEAVITFAEVLKDQAETFLADGSLAMSIVDEDGRTMLILLVSAVEVTPAST